MERLGGQSGTAAAYQNLGILAQGRGELEQAEQLYRRSLEIRLRLGDTAANAATFSQLGILYREIGKLDQSLARHVQALLLRLRVDPTHALIDLRQLAELRTILGDDVIADSVAKSLDLEDLDKVLKLIRQNAPPDPELRSE